MADRLRELLDLVLDSLDETGTDGTTLARRAAFSRDHLDRLLAAATGESAAALRRRLLLERAAWQLRDGSATASAVAGAADYGSLAAFSRAFSRAFGMPPSVFAASGRSPQLDAPNGIHFHPPAGLLVPGAPRPVPPGPSATGGHDLTDRLVTHHLDRSRTLLDAAATLPAEALQRPLRPGFVAVWFEGEEPSGALMAERLVRTLEVWTAAIMGETAPDVPVDVAVDVEALRRRFAVVAPKFSRVARSIRDRAAWDDAFVDALCEPPQSFTYGGVLAHVVTYGAIRREMLASVLAELGAVPPSGPETPDDADPILWEQQRRWG